MAVPTVPPKLATHARKVCSLYKRALRQLLSWDDRRHVFRYQATLLRARFDDNACIQDMREAKALLAEGEAELFRRQCYQPIKFHQSPGGSAFEREVVPPSWVLDYWHPLEKAQYPQYFACREERKKEYIEFWEKQYGKPKKIDTDH